MYLQSICMEILLIYIITFLQVQKQLQKCTAEHFILMKTQKQPLQVALESPRRRQGRNSDQCQVQLLLKRLEWLQQQWHFYQKGMAFHINRTKKFFFLWACFCFSISWPQQDLKLNSKAHCCSPQGGGTGLMLLL